MPTTLDISAPVSEAPHMEFTTTPTEGATMSDRIESIYADLKLADRLTPGRTPWQTLRKRAEEIAASETTYLAEVEFLAEANEVAKYNPTHAIQGWLTGYLANGEMHDAAVCERALEIQHSWKVGL